MPAAMRSIVADALGSIGGEGLSHDDDRSRPSFPSRTRFWRANCRLSRSTTSAGRWPAICGGPGIPKSSTCSAISIRFAGGSSITTPIALLARVHARAARPAGGRDGALQPHQLRPSPAEGVHGEQADVGGLERGRAGRQAGGLFLGRVRPARVDPDLFRRPGRALGRPHQKRQRPGREPGRHRPVLRPGLFQAAARRDRLAARGIHRHQGRERADGAGPLARGQADHRPRRYAHRRRCSPRCG